DIVQQENSAKSAPSNVAEAERLRAALDAALEVAYESDFSKDRILWQGDAGRLFHLRPDRVPTTPRNFAKLLAADILSDFHAAGAGVETGRNFEPQFPIEGTDQIVRWFEVRGRCEFADGHPSRHWGIIRDITHQKRVEARLEYLAGYDELTGHLNRTRLRQA